MDYEAEDKAILIRCLLNLRVCPRCRQDLLPVALLSDVYGCAGRSYPQHAPETWHLPELSKAEQA